MVPRPHRSTLLPCTTLFRSRRGQGIRAVGLARRLLVAPVAHRHRRASVNELTRLLGNALPAFLDRKSTRLNSSHANTSSAVFCLKTKNIVARGLAGRMS